MIAQVPASAFPSGLGMGWENLQWRTGKRDKVAYLIPRAVWPLRSQGEGFSSYQQLTQRSQNRLEGDPQEGGIGSAERISVVPRDKGRRERQDPVTGLLVLTWGGDWRFCN